MYKLKPWKMLNFFMDSDEALKRYKRFKGRVITGDTSEKWFMENDWWVPISDRNASITTDDYSWTPIPLQWLTYINDYREFFEKL